MTTVSTKSNHLLSQVLKQPIADLDDRLAHYASSAIPGLGRLLSARGKRFRSQLLFVILIGLERPVDAQAVSAATSIELVHTASLIHDDMLDGGTIRWGVPTISAVEGQATALVSGDYLLARACSLATATNPRFGVIIAETIASMCVGQALELDSQFYMDRSLDLLIDSATGKTAALFMAACTMGGILGELNSRHLDHIVSFGRQLGIAYQLYDDIDDFERANSSQHKAATRDFQNGNFTMPILLALQTKHAQQLRVWLEQPQTVSPDKVLRLLRTCGALGEAKNIADRYMDDAQESLDKLQNHSLTDAINFLLSANTPHTHQGS